MAVCRGSLLAGVGEWQTNKKAERGGVVYWVLVGTDGLRWLLREHWVYAILFLLFGLAVWSVFGGAIYRIAALQAAREEKISIRQAMRFSISKFFSFFTAPLIPLLLFFLAGLAVTVGAVIFGNWWGIGSVLIGLLFFLAVNAGLVMAFLAAGFVGGCGLMYPTIAVEGSDSFDAISRSFSYIFERPWRAIIYALVAFVHGTACYLFVRAFAFVALRSTRFFTAWGLWQGGGGDPAAADKLDVMWPIPTFGALSPAANVEAMSTMECAGAWLISVWVYIIIGLVVAFILSYASSATTVIYYLLRRKVDATDLDDVYVEEADEGDQMPVVEAEEAAPEAEDDPDESDEEEADDPKK